MIRCAVTGLRVFGLYAVVTERHFFVHPVMTRGTSRCGIAFVEEEPSEVSYTEPAL